ITTWNIGAERAKWYRSEEVIGRRFLCFYTQDDLEAGIPMQLLKLGEGQGKAVDEGWRVRKDGTQFWADVVITAVHNEQGKLIGFSIVTWDLTERKRAEDEIRRLLAEAKQREHELREKQAQLVQTAKLASIGELATGIAHELNNPLNNIGLFVGNAMDYVKLDKPKEVILDDLQTALKQVHRGADIINHLRAFGRPDPMQMRPVSANSAVRAGLSLVEQQLRVRNIEVILDLSPDDAMVLGNQTQLEQIFVNLLSNARDALSEAPKKTITIRSMVRPNEVEVTVSDNGVGIAPEDQARIFDPFFTTKPVGEGTGLGLSITYGIIKEHNGSIAVESRPGEGATFSVRPPLTELSGLEKATENHEEGGVR
ncbi:MAG: PAS domain S-box protein, partial [Nitrospiraceae bacterium]|nr:PAS domain S-box protein [Nitrospiraceae bacterium]